MGTQPDGQVIFWYQSNWQENATEPFVAQKKTWRHWHTDSCFHVLSCDFQVWSSVQKSAISSKFSMRCCLCPCTLDSYRTSKPKCLLARKKQATCDCTGYTSWHIPKLKTWLKLKLPVEFAESPCLPEVEKKLFVCGVFTRESALISHSSPLGPVPKKMYRTWSKTWNLS